MSHEILAAVRITRSRIGVVVFKGTKLEFVRCLNLPFTNRESAVASLENFLGWVIEQFRRPTLAMEEQGARAGPESLTDEVANIAKAHNLPLITIPVSTIFQAYAFPAVQSRSELRSIAAVIWPTLGLLKQREILDAAAFGLYAQTENLLAARY